MLSDGKEKAEVIFSYQKKYGYDYLFETGTSFAETLRAVAILDDEAESKHFEHLFSFESDHAKYLGAIEYTYYYYRITVLYGDSAVHLPRLMDKMNAPAIVFLDAHAAVPEEPTPIMEELGGVLYRGNTLGKKHVVLIDDARLFGDWPTWPTLGHISNLAIANNYSFELEDDIIRLEPNE